MEGLSVERLERFEPRIVGHLASDGSSFVYDAAYLESSRATPLSQSLPLQTEAFSAREFRLYFEGLLAEGPARRALASELQLPEDDYLALLEACGRDCIGDVVISRAGSDGAREPAFYEPIDSDRFRALFCGLPCMAEENAASRLSLAGTQGKIGLAHDPRQSMDEGWLRPHGLAATTHILKTSHLRDIPEIEFLCMKAAALCGLEAARVGLIDAGASVLAVERFDRESVAEEGELRVRRLHQEDLAQALGVTPASKYAELEGGTVRVVARLFKERSVRPARDIASFARMLCFAYLVGDCDAHLKNYAVLYPDAGRGGAGLSLAPAYDFVCTTRYPRFSRDMAMALGGVRAIDEVRPDTFDALAGELGITKAALRTLVRPLVERASEAMRTAADGGCGPTLASTPYIADDLVEDMAPRRAVLKAFCDKG